MTEEDRELDTVRRFIAAYRMAPARGRVEVWKDPRPGAKDDVRIIHGQSVLASSTIAAATKGMA